MNQKWLLADTISATAHFWNARVNGEILAKFRYVCSYVGHSANSPIIQLMLRFIADYEKGHGKIEFPSEKK